MEGMQRLHVCVHLESLLEPVGEQDYDLDKELFDGLHSEYGNWTQSCEVKWEAVPPLADEDTMPPLLRLLLLQLQDKRGHCLTALNLVHHVLPLLLLLL